MVVQLTPSVAKLRKRISKALSPTTTTIWKILENCRDSTYHSVRSWERRRNCIASNTREATVMSPLTSHTKSFALHTIIQIVLHNDTYNCMYRYVIIYVRIQWAPKNVQSFRLILSRKAKPRFPLWKMRQKSYNTIKIVSKSVNI